MVEPLLFLQFLRGILTPLFFPSAVKAGGEVLETAYKSVDTIVYTWLVMAILILVSILTTKALKSMPGGLQNFMEVVVGGIEKTVADTMGKHGMPFFPLIATLFLFILISNLISLVPGFYPPTANLNTTAGIGGHCLHHDPRGRCQGARPEVCQTLPRTGLVAGLDDIFHRNHRPFKQGALSLPPSLRQHRRP